MDEFLEAVKKAKEKAKTRKFVQSWDLAIGLRNIDLKKPENKLNLEFTLPEGKGKDVKTVFVVDSLLEEAEKHADLVITKEQLNSLVGNKKKIKKYAEEYDWWFAEAPLMPLIGKNLGAVLGVRGKMPKPIPPKVKIEPFIEFAKRSIRIRVRDSPVIHVSIGTERMSEDQIAKNASAVFNFVKEKLPKGKNNIRSVYVKLTMGPGVKVNI